ncbi:hypothetical protein ACJ41O_001706 [Fusarium nematophilum]
MTEVMSVQAQERCTWQHFAVDLAAAAFASALVTPWVTAIDKIVFNKATTGASASSSLRKLASKPKAALGALFIPFLVYFGTYATANMFDSFHAVTHDLDPSTVCSSPSKFVATTAVSTGLCIFKDAHVARMASGGPTPLLSYALFAARDAVTVFASFNLPTMLAPKLADIPFSSITPFSAIFASDESRLKLAQMVMPAASQVISTPIHLLGLDIHCRQKKLGIRERFSVVRYYAGFATPLRMMRIIPSFGIGSVANRGFRNSMMTRVM